MTENNHLSRRSILKATGASGFGLAATPNVTAKPTKKSIHLVEVGASDRIIQLHEHDFNLTTVSIDIPPNGTVNLSQFEK